MYVAGAAVNQEYSMKLPNVWYASPAPVLLHKGGLCTVALTSVEDTFCLQDGHI